MSEVKGLYIEIEKALTEKVNRLRITGLSPVTISTHALTTARWAAKWGHTSQKAIQEAFDSALFLSYNGGIFSPSSRCREVVSTELAYTGGNFHSAEW